MLATKHAVCLGRVSGILVCFLAVSYWQALASGKPERTVAFPTKAIFSIGVDSLGIDKNARITDFSISPEADRVAAGFETSDSEKRLTMWLGQWDLKTGKLVTKVHLDKLISATVGAGFASFFHNTIQYSPDGSKIIVRAGDDVYGLQSSNLATLYTIFPANGNSTSSDPFAQVFSISGDGASLAVLIGQSESPPKEGTVYIYDANTGTEKAHWSAPAQISNLCLSRNGNYVLLTVAHYPTDILLLDGSSGRVIKRFASGLDHGAGPAAANALFLDEQHFVATPGTNANGGSSAAKVFDLATGSVTAELMFENSGWPQDMWLSSNNAMVAVLKTSQSSLKKHLSFTESGGAKNAHIMFFHSNEARPFCTLGPLPEKHDKPFRSSGFIRLSPDLKIVGLLVEDRASLYSTSDCTNSSGME